MLPLLTESDSACRQLERMVRSPMVPNIAGLPSSFFHKLQLPADVKAPPAALKAVFQLLLLIN